MRKKITFATVIILLAAGGYYWYASAKNIQTGTRYVSAAVEKGTLIISVSGSGQVSASNQVDVNSKVSGDVVFVGVKNGQEVKAGALLVQIDSRDAAKAVRDAEISLETAKLELEQLMQPADDYSLMQAENALTQAKENLTKLKFTQADERQAAEDAKEKAEDDLAKAYEDGFNNVASVFLDLPNIMAGMDDILFGYGLSGSSRQWNIDGYADAAKIYDEKALQYKTDASGKYQTAREAYDGNFQNYKSASRYSETSLIESLIGETYETNKNKSQAQKSSNNLIQFYKDKLIERGLKPNTLADTHLSSISSYTSKTNSFLLNLLSVQNTIKNSKEAISGVEDDIVKMDRDNPLDLAAAERIVEEKEESLAKLKAGPDELDIRAKKISIQQKEDALLSAKQGLADYYIRAPFDGVAANVDAKKGESVPSIVASLITKQKLSEISLNEVDVAQVKVGQKANITFDAVEELAITGEVAEIDTLGAVSQGVVTYGVKIIFDTQDERVKPGMSASASVITDVKQDILLAPNSAIKQQGDSVYVEIMANPESGSTVSGGAPERRTVETGLANDTVTEIISGLQEGEQVVTQTITGNNSTQTQSQNRSFGAPGGGMMMIR